MSNEYNPLQHSIVQASVGTWCRYECDDFIEALLMAILAEITRVHWNIYQHSWGASWHADEIEDPEIPGIQFTRYYDGCECEDEPEHRKDCRHARPNFQHEDVQFRWYKYPGRGMSTNKEWNAEEWRAWFQRCLATIRSFESVDMETHYSAENQKRQDALRQSLRDRFPNAFSREYPDQRTQAMRGFFAAMEEMENAQTPCWACSEAGMFSNRGGGTFENGVAGCVARTLHENDDPIGPCRNCGHVNSEQEMKALEERRRVNNDDCRARFSSEIKDE